jgi:hypothetical protein
LGGGVTDLISSDAPGMTDEQLALFDEATGPTRAYVYDELTHEERLEVEELVARQTGERHVLFLDFFRWTQAPTVWPGEEVLEHPALTTVDVPVARRFTAKHYISGGRIEDRLRLYVESRFD